MPASVTLSDLTWSAPDRPPLFSNLNLSLGSVRTGLVGRNGVGKTTLLRLIAGELRPRSGSVAVSGTLGVLRQSVQASPDETVADLLGATAALAVLHRAERGEATDNELADADWAVETRIAAALGRVGPATAARRSSSCSPAGGPARSSSVTTASCSKPWTPSSN
jgi:ATPase subunit of ABC transporter with duplicated ATPase domains